MTVVLIGTALLLSVYMVVNILYKRTNHYRNPDRDLENYRQVRGEKRCVSKFGRSENI